MPKAYYIPSQWLAVLRCVWSHVLVSGVDADPRGPTMRIFQIDFETRAAFIDDVVGSILL